MDFVASAMGVPINVQDSCIDLGLLGSQKCLSLPPDLSIITVSPLAWQVIEEVNYCGTSNLDSFFNKVGYDALKPWKNASEIKYFPYTMNWRAIAALDLMLDKILEEGQDKVEETFITF